MFVPAPLKFILKLENRPTKLGKQCYHGNTCYCACAVGYERFSWGECLYTEQAAVRRSLIVLVFGCCGKFGVIHFCIDLTLA